MPFFSDLGDGYFFDKVLSEQGDFLFGGEVATLLSHEYSSARVLPLTLTKANSCFDWSNTPLPPYVRQTFHEIPAAIGVLRQVLEPGVLLNWDRGWLLVLRDCR